MEEDLEQKEMSLNNTTPHVSPLKPKPQFPGCYVLILFVLLILAACAVAAVRAVVVVLLTLLHYILHAEQVIALLSADCLCQKKSEVRLLVQLPEHFQISLPSFRFHFIFYVQPSGHLNCATG